MPNIAYPFAFTMACSSLSNHACFFGKHAHPHCSGTSGTVRAGVARSIYRRADDQFRPNPQRAMHAFCHCLPGRWHEMSVMLSAAACVEWVAKLAGYSDVGTALNEAERCHDLRSAEIFLPYLSGERTPHNDPHAQGVFFG